MPARTTHPTVTVRGKATAKGTRLYLDIYHNGSRRKQTLPILLTGDRLVDEEYRRRAEIVRRKVEKELLDGLPEEQAAVTVIAALDHYTALDHMATATRQSASVRQIVLGVVGNTLTLDKLNDSHLRSILAVIRVRTLIVVIALLSIAMPATIKAQGEFKGLRLGMTLSEVIALVDSTRWGWEHGPKIALEDTANRSFVIFLGPDGYPYGRAGSYQRERDTFARIGCSIIDKDTTCPAFDMVSVSFFDGKAHLISVSSTSNMDEFASLAIETLTRRYGKPNSGNWKKGSSVFTLSKNSRLSQWVIGKMTVTVSYYTSNTLEDSVSIYFDLPAVTKKALEYEKKKRENPTTKPGF